MTDITIRQATAEDAEAIYEIERLCFADPWSLESIRFELEENPAAFYVVAEVEGEATDDSSADGLHDDTTAGLVVGYAGLWWIHDEGHITNVAVRPGYRNRRIGSHIIETLLDHTEGEGINSYTLEVRESNDAARALYEKYGFAVEGVRKEYYRDNKEDAYIMWRRAPRHGDADTTETRNEER